MNEPNCVEGRNTSFGHTDTQSWQAVQCWVKLRKLIAPAGTIGVARFGIFLSTITAKPPSTFFSCAFSVAVVRANVAAERNPRRELSGFVGAGSEIGAGFAFR